MTVDLSNNPKQELFFNTSIKAVFGVNDYRYLFYGGAIRGGKSFVCATLFIWFAKHFDNSRWHIFRSDFPALQSTTIPTFEKIIAGNTHFKWSRDKSNFYLEYIPNGSKIFFKGENISHDPEMNDLLGLETNGIWYEQIEELSEKLWEIGMSRAGSWYIDPMPKPLILGTFNPTQNWIKDKIYLPYRNDELKAPYYYLQALPNDNPFVTQEQWAAWGNMADRYQSQFIEGDWTDYADKNALWAFAFDKEKHVKPTVLDRTQMVYLSFDFNKNPICCSVIQWYDETVRVIETIKLSHSDIYALCDYIKVHYSGCMFKVTGDASGQSTNAMVKDNLNYYIVIRNELKLMNSQIEVPTINPRLEDNQVLVNSLLSRYNIEIDSEKGKGLIFDMMNVRMLPDGTIEKANRNDPKQQSDALDTFRYFCNTYLAFFIRN